MNASIPYSDGYLIRPGKLSDANEIARLTLEWGHSATFKDIADRLGRLLDDPKHTVIVSAGQRDSLNGWIHVEQSISLEIGDLARISGLVVDTKARRRGIGARLVSAAEQWAATRGLSQIVVRSNIVRDAAHDFYTAIGYERIKTQHVYQKRLTGNLQLNKMA